jgi:hypothetical protein
MGCRRFPRTVSAFHVGLLSATVLLLGFELNLICDPAIISLSAAAMKRKKQIEDDRPISSSSSKKGVHPTQLLYLIGQTASARNIGTDLPFFV